jgi:hypothetical protein
VVAEKRTLTGPVGPPAYCSIIHRSTVGSRPKRQLQRLCDVRVPKALRSCYKEEPAPRTAAASPCLSSCTTLLYVAVCIHHQPRAPNYRAAITPDTLPDEAPRRSVPSARPTPTRACLLTSARPPRSRNLRTRRVSPRHSQTTFLRKRPLQPRGDL